MADHRSPEARIVLETPAGRRVAELFPAALFAARAPGEHAGRYRVRIDRAWHAPGGQKYAFLTLAEAFSVLAGLDSAPASEPRPRLPLGSYVRVPSSWVDGEPVLYSRTYTRSAPFQGVDGRWRVLCMLFPDPVLVEDIKTVEVRKR